MANIQACGSAEAYEAKHKSIVDDIINKAESIIAKILLLHGAKTGGCIMNVNVKGNCMKLLNNHDWSGKNTEPYPKSIAKCDFGTFGHAASFLGHSDEAAVVYADECGSAFLLAWSVKDHIIGSICHSNKVYIESGPIENYMNINWHCIKAKLDKASDTSYCYDCVTGNEAFAKISPGDKAKLVAACGNISC